MVAPGLSTVLESVVKVVRLRKVAGLEAFEHAYYKKL